jgi:hypothetical protein
MRKTAIACVLVLSTTSGLAGAQPAVDKASAQALFEAGKRLMEEGKFAEGCPKFAESQRLDPAPGTLLNLADCYDKSGLTASAWATWLEAAASAKTAGQTERERTARERAAALKSRLVTVTINVPEANRIAGLEVRRDGNPVGIVTWGTGVPVDPGSHTVVANAPGRRGWQTTVTVVDGVQPVHVTVPRLEVETASPPAQPPPQNAAGPIAAPMPMANPNPNMGLSPMPPAAGTPGVPFAPAAGAPLRSAPVASPERGSDPGSTQRTWAYVAGGVGIVGLGVGTIFGLKAKSKNNDSIQQCTTETLCSQAGYDLRQEALTAATYSTIAFGVGTAALVTGIVLLATAPSSQPVPTQAPPTQPRARWSVDGSFAASTGSLTIKGGF